mgnify:CR=1 FL=1
MKIKPKIGKLYQFKEVYWLLYPSFEIAVAVNCSIPTTTSTQFLSRRFNCNISLIQPAEMFVLLEQIENRFCKILTGDGVLGWSCMGSYFLTNYIEEVNQ